MGNVLQRGKRNLGGKEHQGENLEQCPNLKGRRRRRRSEGEITYRVIV